MSWLCIYCCDDASSLTVNVSYEKKYQTLRILSFTHGLYYVSGVPIISHKDLMMHKGLNVPPTPSPDSAVHSAYSVFSSPNQSPLTQRHVTLTPNLSRNNSDASHSSCCSYSSVSVSVSPTQQFSPTHSPIQVS